MAEPKRPPGLDALVSGVSTHQQCFQMAVEQTDKIISRLEEIENDPEMPDAEKLSKGGALELRLQLRELETAIHAVGLTICGATFALLETQGVDLAALGVHFGEKPE